MVRSNHSSSSEWRSCGTTGSRPSASAGSRRRGSSTRTSSSGAAHSARSRQLLEDVTGDPAMLRWLNGDKNTVRSPNENYAREMMELFTLGVNRGYTENDIREQARALTGWRGMRRGRRRVRLQLRASPARRGMKTVFGKSGAFDWQDACRLCLEHPNHAVVLRREAVELLRPTAPPAANAARARGDLPQRLPDPAGRRGDPPASRALHRPADGEAAGRLRSRAPAAQRAAASQDANWANLGATAGQRLFRPPNVAGWDDKRWLDTSTFRGRWFARGRGLAATGRAVAPRNAGALVDRAAAGLGIRTLTKPTRTVATRLAKDALKSSAPDVAEQAVRQLLALSPEVQTS